jgi:hypothetical protein
MHVPRACALLDGEMESGGEKSTNSLKSLPPGSSNQNGTLVVPALSGSGLESKLAHFDFNAAQFILAQQQLQQQQQQQQQQQLQAVSGHLPLISPLYPGLPMQAAAGRPGWSVTPLVLGGVQGADFSAILGGAGLPLSGVVGVNTQQVFSAHEAEIPDTSEPVEHSTSQSKLSAKTAAEIYSYRPPRTGKWHLPVRFTTGSGGPCTTNKQTIRMTLSRGQVQTGNSTQQMGQAQPC